ncbi:MAG: HAD-IB family phosphatase, partial [Patescibacteria group bacterium]
MQNQYFIIDFDSTFIKGEALDELARIVLKKNAKKKEIVRKIEQITQRGMEGKITFPQSLAQRLSLLDIEKRNLDELIKVLKKEVSSSVKRNKEFFQKYADSIYIISGGFKEYIYPVVKSFGIAENHVLANSFNMSKNGKIQGYDTKNPLSQDSGKAKQLRLLNLKGKIFVVGDGYTDYQAKELGKATSFFAFVENVKRDAVLQKADIVVANLDELLFLFNLPRAYSYPKSKMKVLLLEKIDPVAVTRFTTEGYEVEALATALDEDELIKKIKDVHILGIRSKTEVTAKVLSKADKLLAIGAFCIGTNQIDLTAAATGGVTVFN